MDNKLNRVLDKLGTADVLYIGIGFTGYRMAGDKNFYIDLFEGLVKKGLKLIVISVSDPVEDKIVVDTSTAAYPIVHIRRPFHRKKPETWWIKNSRFISNHHKHHFLREYWERMITLNYWTRTINKVIKKTSPEYIHFLDSFVFYHLNLNTAKIIVTQTKYEKKAGLLYYFYMRLLFSKAQKGIVFNQRQLDYFPKKVLEKVKFIVQPWGVYEKENGSNEKCRLKWMNNPENFMVLWSGYLMQISYRDFLFAKKLAELVVEKYDGIEFVFAFKPEVNIVLPVSSDKIKFVKSEGNFNELLNASDLFFSPLCESTTIIGPPLTWIEYISNGKPILTTNVNGLDSYFTKDESILTFKNENELLQIFEAISNNNLDIAKIGQGAYEVFRKFFNLVEIIENYLAIYKN